VKREPLSTAERRVLKLVGMMSRILALAFCVVAASASCGGSTETSNGTCGNAGAHSTGGSSSANDAAFCQQGCVATVAAHCSNGPATQASCESQCKALASGSCGTEYHALQSCAVGKTISCSAEGLPSIPGCATQQNAFVACLN
jgi:hypothetical protein